MPIALASWILAWKLRFDCDFHHLWWFCSSWTTACFGEGNGTIPLARLSYARIIPPRTLQYGQANHAKQGPAPFAAPGTWTMIALTFSAAQWRLRHCAQLFTSASFCKQPLGYITDIPVADALLPILSSITLGAESEIRTLFEDATTPTVPPRTALMALS